MTGAGTFTISKRSAVTLVRESNEDQLELLRLFVRHQVLNFPMLQREFGRDQDSLNLHLLGPLIRRFKRVEGDSKAGFYSWNEDTREWAIGSQSRRNLRAAFKEVLGETI